jgi:hypothetical protein
MESTDGYTLDVGVGALGEFGMFDGELEMWSRTFTIRRGLVKSTPAAAVAATDAAATSAAVDAATAAAAAGGGGGAAAAAAAASAGGSDSPRGGTAVTLRVFEDPSEAGTNGEYILWPSSVMMARFLQVRGEEK